jgi:hypothetical protein
MSRVLTMLCVIALAASARAQSFEVSGIQDNYKAFIGETIKAPVRIRNTTDKPIFLTVKKISAQIGGTQRNYYCLDNNCLDQRTEEYTLRLEPDQVVNSLHIAVEAGLARWLTVSTSLSRQVSLRAMALFDTMLRIRQIPLR